MTKVLRLAAATIGLLVILLPVTGTLSLTFAQAAPATGTWKLTGSMHVARYGHTATLLKNGKVLVAGGSGTTLTSAELYDPTTGKWSLTGSLNVARENFKATPLPNGKVLVEGGIDSSGMALVSAELYDPTTGKWSLTGSMNAGRENHSAVLLSNGQVLVSGGDTGTQNNPYVCTIASAELYNPTTGTWSLTGSLHVARRFDSPSILLPNGKVLVAGGDDGAGYTCQSSSHGSTSHSTSFTGTGTSTHNTLSTVSYTPSSPCFCPHSLKSAELYDPTTGTWSLTGNMNTPRVSHSATSLPNNKVLVAGGEKCTNIYAGFCKTLATAEVYDATRGTWSLTGSLHSVRAGHLGTRLTSTVLVAGGGIASSELYNPSTGTWSLSGSMNVARSGNTQTRLSNGQVLVTGGRGSSGVLRSAELYTP